MKRESSCHQLIDSADCPFGRAGRRYAHGLGARLTYRRPEVAEAHTGMVPNPPTDESDLEVTTGTGSTSGGPANCDALLG
jgi:hypothetical protein